MGMRCTIDVIDDLGYPEATPILGIPIDYSDAMDTFCDTFDMVSESLVPVDTGYLLSTLSSDNNGDTEINCIADAEYAQYVEYGTYKMGAQPYFRPAIAAALSMSKMEFQDAVDEAMEEESEMLAAMSEEEEDEDGAGGFGGGIAGFLGGLFATILISLVQGFINMISYDERANDYRAAGSMNAAIISAGELEHLIETY